MARRTLDPRTYPLAWEESYGKGASGWRSDGARGSTRMTGDGTGRALELGAGNGAAAAELARCGWSGGIICLDVSGTALASFPRRLAADGRVARVVGDARRLPFEDGVFGYVMARHVLTHALGSDDLAILAEAARVLAPGGTLSAEVFSLADARRGKGEELGGGAKLRDGGLVWRFYDEAGLSGLLERAGFTKVAIKTASRQVAYGGAEMTRESLVAEAAKPAG